MKKIVSLLISITMLLSTLSTMPVFADGEASLTDNKIVDVDFGGTYDYRTGTFTLKKGKTLENQEEYINKINNKVNNAFSISKMIIDTNYYTYILNKEM